MIRSLQEAGYRVICFAPVDEYTELLTEEDIEIYPLHRLSRKGTNPLQDIRFISELKRAYRTHRIDLAIHFTIKPNVYGSIAARQAGIPSISVVTGLGYTFLSRGLANRSAMGLYRYAFRKNQLTIFQNPDDRTLFVQRRLVRESRSTVILGSGIDTDYHAHHTLVPANSTFLFIGRLLNDKGIRELLNGFALFSEKHPESKLIILGDPDSQNPASVSEMLLLRYRQHRAIRFVGFQPDVRPYIRDASAVVLPSYREGVPKTLLEALSVGRPVITTDVPGCREVVRPGENGLLIPSHDERALADAFEKFHLLDESVKQQMGQKSREMAEAIFSTEVVNADYLKWVEKVLGDR